VSDVEVWIVIVLLAASTLLTRCGIVMIGHRVTIPKRVQEMLRFAPACALTSIVVPDLALGADGEVALNLANPRLVAGLLSLGFYLLRRNLLQSIVFGMLVFTLLRVFHVFGAGA
jgi:branched-subunit amino acid transport protein